jgi:hypothetical protein
METDCSIFKDDSTTGFQNAGTICPKKCHIPEDLNHHTACSSIKKKCPIDVITRLKETRTPVCTKPASQTAASCGRCLVNNELEIMWKV